MRSVRRTGRTAERRPTSSSRSAPLLLCPRRACSLELTRRRRASAEPRARRSLSAPPTLSSAHRSCRRAQRAPFGRTAERRPTPSSRSAPLPLCLSPRLFTRTDTTTASERRPRARRSLLAPPTLSSAHRSCRRAPTDAILTFSLLLLCLSPRLFTRTDTTTVSERRAASTSFPVSAADPAGRAPNVSPCTACAVLALFPIRVPRSRHQPRRAIARGASHPTDARRSRSHCSPPRAIRSRGARFFSLCGRSPSGAPVSPVLAAPLFASGCAQVQAKHSPGTFSLVISQERNGPVWRPSDGALLFGT